MTRPLVIIHGWSDDSNSFRDLARFLGEARGTPVTTISLADYVSLSDEVTFADLAAAMDKAWDDRGLPRVTASVDAVVHSTGGLVIRDWMSRTFAVGTAPVKNLVMLAPANFGSPLAHKGRSFIGRVIKGFGNPEGSFQTGEKILKGLEIASPYSWNLAMRDRFGLWADSYGPGGVLCTVLVGNKGYDGIRAIANEDGSDGTVRVSTANMRCERVEIDFTSEPLNPTMTRVASRGSVAFAVMDGHNHASITLNGSRLRSEADRDLLARIVESLGVTDAAFGDFAARLDAETDAVMESRARDSSAQGFQNTVVRVVDHEGAAVGDYLIEFYEEDDDRDLIAKLFHTTSLASVHAYSDDPSYRSLYINCTRLARTIDKIKEALSLSISAHPVVGPSSPVGFRSLSDEDIGSIKIPAEKIAEFFRPNRTVLMTMKLLRSREDRVFRFVDAT